MERLDRQELLEDLQGLAGAVAAFVAQLYFKSLPIGAMCGLLVMLATGAINPEQYEAYERRRAERD